MESGHRLWKFVVDMNFDGLITFSDVWTWFKWLFFYPGDLILLTVITVFPELAQVFELGPDNYGGRLSGLISGVAWIFIFLVVYGAWTLITETLGFLVGIIRGK
jgi:hypothetical protein